MTFARPIPPPHVFSRETFGLALSTALFPGIYLLLILARWRWLNILLLAGGLLSFAFTVLPMRLGG